MNMNKKNKFVYTNIILGFVLLFIMGCTTTQKASFTPQPTAYTVIDKTIYTNGFPKEAQPWVVFSDRSNNKIFQTQHEDLFTMYKEASFLAPFVVLKKDKGMYKVAAYKDGLINEGNLPKGKSLTILGWLPEERLLLWSNSLKNSGTGFSTKAALVVNNVDVIRQSDKYVDNDSVVVYSDPELVTLAGKKISLGSLVYIYKYSDDKEKVLIGKEQGSIVNRMQDNIYGWVSNDVVALWGERSALQVATTDNQKNEIGVRPDSELIGDFIVSPAELQERNGIEAIYPQVNNEQIKLFTNVFNYDNNKIYNVLGDPINYRRYKNILSENKKLNVVFVLDASRNNRLYFPLVKSLLQELQLQFRNPIKNPSYFSSIKFGGVVYKQNNCGVSPLYSDLSSNYKEVTTFFESKIEQLNCSDANLTQPVDKGLLAATRMLSDVSNETNVIILIGTTATENIQSQAVINAISRTNSRLVFFQTQSKSADAYNDFVLLGEKIVINSAQNITERKKQKIVNQSDLLQDINFSLSTGENGVYFLNYPSESMTQGFVLFPKKGEAMGAGLLKSAIDTILIQVAADNEHIDKSLTKYFQSEIGVSNTKLRDSYFTMFPLEEQYIPTPIAASLLNHNTSFLVNGKITGENDSIVKSMLKHGVLVNEQEYDQLRNFYTNVYKTVFAKGKFSKYVAINSFLMLSSRNIASLKKMDKARLEKLPMRDVIQLTTGFSMPDDYYMNMTAQKWIKNRELSLDMVSKFFKEFGEIAVLMGNMKSDKTIRVEHKGQIFYWLDDSYVPKMNAIAIVSH